MFGFGKKNSFLGIDVGTSAIKILEIKIKDNKPVLSNYAWMNMEDSLGNAKSTALKGDLAEYVKKIIKEAGFKSKDGYVSIPSFGGLITIIDFPKMDESDIAQAIRFEAHKYIPTPLEDIVLSWDIINEKSSAKKDKNALPDGSAQKTDDEGTMQILLAAAPKSKIEKYENLIKQVGLNLKSIEIENFSLARSLVGNDKGKFVIADIGSRVCNIVLLENGIIRVNRNIDAGGRDITKIIARATGIEEVRAEKMKISGTNFFKDGMGVSFPVLDLIIGEIKRVLSAHVDDKGEARVETVILSGGTANLTGLKEYFSNALGIKTIVGDPFGRIECDKKLEPKLNLIKSQFSVCAGLALKGAEEYLNK